MSMHAGTGRSIWLRLGLRLVSMPPPIGVRWLNTIAVGCRSIPRNTPQYKANRKRKRQLAKEDVNIFILD